MKMKTKCATIGAMLLASAAVVAPASAAPLIVTFSGTYTGTREGNGFTTFATFTGKGDTEAAVITDNVYTLALSSLTAFADNTLFTVQGQSSFFITEGGNPNLGFFNADGLISALTGTDVSFGNNKITLAGPAYGFDYKFLTDKGAVVITGLTDAKVTLAAGVPEPATWGLMIAGFGMVGAAMRRRRQPSLTVSYS